MFVKMQLCQGSKIHSMCSMTHVLSGACSDVRIDQFECVTRHVDASALEQIHFALTQNVFILWLVPVINCHCQVLRPAMEMKKMIGKNLGKNQSFYSFPFKLIVERTKLYANKVTPFIWLDYAHPIRCLVTIPMNRYCSESVFLRLRVLASSVSCSIFTSVLIFFLRDIPSTFVLVWACFRRG